jgi:RimJ/RimL family protein N-acetyltransferase
MSNNFFIGQRIRLSGPNPETDAAEIARWSRDPEFMTMLSSDIARPWTPAAVIKDMEEGLSGDEPKPGLFPFLIHTLEAECQPARLVGLIDLSLDHWSHRDAWIAIGIGERSDWGQGYGSDAMRLIVCYAFSELNLHRVSLTVFEYNERAQRTYRKLGFVEEGRHRERLLRFGKRWDMVVMGLLRSQWDR